jgi:hypothetical protein
MAGLFISSGYAPPKEAVMTLLWTTDAEVRRQAREIYLPPENEPPQDREAMIQAIWAHWSKVQQIRQDTAWSHVSAFSCSSLDPRY